MDVAVVCTLKYPTARCDSVEPYMLITVQFGASPFSRLMSRLISTSPTKNASRKSSSTFFFLAYANLGPILGTLGGSPTTYSSGTGKNLWQLPYNLPISIAYKSRVGNGREQLAHCRGEAADGDLMSVHPLGELPWLHDILLRGNVQRRSKVQWRKDVSL